MHLPLRGWEGFWSALGWVRRNRRQRKAAQSKRRSMVRKHRVDQLEARVVMDAAGVDDPDPNQAPAYYTAYQTALQISVPLPKISITD